MRIMLVFVSGSCLPPTSLTCECALEQDGFVCDVLATLERAGWLAGCNELWHNELIFSLRNTLWRADKFGASEACFAPLDLPNARARARAIIETNCALWIRCAAASAADLCAGALCRPLVLCLFGRASGVSERRPNQADSLQVSGAPYAFVRGARLISGASDLLRVR